MKTGRLTASEHGPELELEADVVIIGAGAGGCALAAAVAERGLSAVLLEEGNHWEPEQFQPRTTFALKHLYQARGARSLRGNAVIPMPGGRGVGGSTLINSAICFRTPPDVLASWRDDYGCDSLDDAKFSAYFDRIWATLGVGVNPPEVQRNNNLIFKAGAEKLGLQGEFLPRSAPGCRGCGVCQYGCPSGGKYSADRTFLVEALARGGVAAWSGCRIRAAETRGDEVVAVSGAILDPETQEVVGSVRARGRTFVCSGGPIGSPLFLLANGFADHTHCGEHLVVHPTVSALARFPWEIRPWSGVTQGYYVDCREKGFLLQTFTTTPDQTYLVLQTSLGLETMEVMSQLSHLASAGALVHDEDSQGAVRHTPVGADLSYFLGDGDRRKLIDGMRLTAEVFFAAGALEVFPGRIGHGRITRVEDVADALPHDLGPKELMLYASHPMGTCRMGGDPARSVVDPLGKVWGWKNLRVADASIFPTSLGVNPQVTTMALGLHIGHDLAAG